MRKSFLIIAVALVIVSLGTSCSRGGENSVTGLPNGNRSLSGQVQTVGDLAGSSPAGINVSSNGQIAVTDAAGRFGFTSLPEKNVQLAFSRTDGVNATAMVSATASAVVVELQKTRASVTTTATGQTRELEGTIASIDEAKIVVNNASTKSEVTALIDESTVIRKGNLTLAVTDLKAGDRVHVKTFTNADGELVAREIKLQNSADDDDDDDGGQLKELEGTIAEVSETSITVNNASTRGPVTATITTATVIRKGNTRLTWEDLKKGDRVHVKTTAAADGALTAREIRLQNPA